MPSPRLPLRAPTRVPVALPVALPVAALVAVLAGCSSSPPAPAPPPAASEGPRPAALAKPEPTAAQTAHVDDAPKAPPMVVGSFEARWVSEKLGWNRGLAITPSEVVAASGQELVTLSRDEGRVKKRAPTCAVVLGGLVRLSDTEVVVFCKGEVRALKMPGLVESSLYTPSASDALKGTDVAVGAACGDKLALASRTGKVAVIERGKGKQVAELGVKGEIETLAFSPDCALLAVGQNGLSSEMSDKEVPGMVVVLDVAKRRAIATLKGTDRTRATGVAFAPDGAEVFANVGTFGAMVFDVKTQKATRSYKVGSWISTSTYVAPGLVAAAGSDGLTLLTADGQALVAPIPEQPTQEAVAASSDGSLLCVGDRDGRVFAFGRK